MNVNDWIAIGPRDDPSNTEVGVITEIDNGIARVLFPEFRLSAMFSVAQASGFRVISEAEGKAIIASRKEKENG